MLRNLRAERTNSSTVSNYSGNHEAETETFRVLRMWGDAGGVRVLSIQSSMQIVFDRKTKTQDSGGLGEIFKTKCR